MSVFDPFHHDHINTPRKPPPDNPPWTSDGWGCRMKTGGGGYNPPGVGGLDKSLDSLKLTFHFMALLRRVLSSNPVYGLQHFASVCKGDTCIESRKIIYHSSFTSWLSPCFRYLDTVKPLLSPEDYSRTEQLVHSLLVNEGPVLQKHLQARWVNRRTSTACAIN